MDGSSGVARDSSSSPAFAERLPFVRTRGIAKSYGGVRALHNIDLDIYPGEVHGLVGANGAGKSTFIKLLAGVEIPDAGTIELEARPVPILNPEQSTRLGFSFIHQELNLVPQFNALQNLTLGLPKPKRAGLIHWPSVRANMSGLIKRLGINFSLDVPVSELSVAEQWMVSIGRALIRKARLIAMDEPTASLSPNESERLFRIIRELASDGIAILYVSHRLDEILNLCGTITVFKDGEKVLQQTVKGMTKNDLIQAIVGAEGIAAPPTKSVRRLSERVVLQAKELRRAPRVRDVSLSLHAGEVVGLAGLVGAGRTELANLIFGADAPDHGTMLLDGSAYRPRNPHEATSQGVVLVPEERRSQGLILDRSISFNINLPFLKPARLFAPLPVVSTRRSASRANQIMNQLRIKAETAATPVRLLSGGNQQKVVIGKWLTLAPRLLILDEPSRGVDVGARSEIHRIINELAEHGAAILVISSDDEELPGLCDRVIVMTEGRIAGELRGVEITREAILRLSYHSTI
jgi:ABC-type sugar transport system ATPase subunit